MDIGPIQTGQIVFRFGQSQFMDGLQHLHFSFLILPLSPGSQISAVEIRYQQVGGTKIKGIFGRFGIEGQNGIVSGCFTAPHIVEHGGSGNLFGLDGFAIHIPTDDGQIIGDLCRFLSLCRKAAGQCRGLSPA